MVANNFTAEYLYARIFAVYIKPEIAYSRISDPEAWCGYTSSVSWQLLPEVG